MIVFLVVVLIVCGSFLDKDLSKEKEFVIKMVIDIMDCKVEVLIILKRIVVF